MLCGKKFNFPRFNSNPSINNELENSGNERIATSFLIARLIRVG